MLYLIVASENLFYRWRELETQFQANLLRGLVQNDMYIPTEHLNKEFEELNNEIIRLQGIYQPHALQPIYDLRDETRDYILNTTKEPRDIETLHNLIRYSCPNRDQRSKKGVTLCRVNNTLGNEVECQPWHCPIAHGLLETQRELRGIQNG